MDLSLTCQQIKSQLSEYLDGEVESALCAELERHLRHCENCRVMVDTLNKTVLLYRQYGRVSAPADLAARLIRVLDLKETPRARPPDGP